MEYPLSCFPQGGNDGFVLSRSIVSEFNFKKGIGKNKGGRSFPPWGNKKGGNSNKNDASDIITK